MSAEEDIHARNLAMQSGVAARNRSISQGVTVRNYSLESGIQARNHSLVGGMTTKGGRPPGNGPTPVSQYPKAFAPLARKINELGEWIKGIQGGPGIQITKSKAATIISFNGSQAGANNPISATGQPFDAIVSGTSLKIRYGTINMLAPSNIGSTFTIPGSGTRYLVLTVTASNGAVVSSVLSIETSPPAVLGNQIGYPQSTFAILLSVIVNLTPFRVIGPGSLQALSKEVFRVQKVMLTPDLLPYDSYYTWDISVV